MLTIELRISETKTISYNHCNQFTLGKIVKNNKN